MLCFINYGNVLIAGKCYRFYFSLKINKYFSVEAAQRDDCFLFAIYMCACVYSLYVCEFVFVLECVYKNKNNKIFLRILAKKIFKTL